MIEGELDTDYPGHAFVATRRHGSGVRRTRTMASRIPVSDISLVAGGALTRAQPQCESSLMARPVHDHARDHQQWSRSCRVPGDERREREPDSQSAQKPSMGTRHDTITRGATSNYWYL